jgi:hypothetical protein
MHRLHFKYDYQAAILENQLGAITPELMAGSTPNIYMYLLGILYGFFTRGEHHQRQFLKRCLSHLHMR